MDYNQEEFFRAQFEAPKMPFYMSYPMQNLYLTEMEYEKDMERMKELYPREVKQILEYVEEECDKMEYEGSLMFDEYPDRLMLEMVVNRILNQVMEGDDPEDMEDIEDMEDVEAQQFRGGSRPSGNRPPHRPRRRDFRRELINVILNNEMFRRRCRHRRCRRWW